MAFPVPVQNFAGVSQTGGVSGSVGQPTVGNIMYVAVYRFAATAAPTDTGGNTYAQLGSDSVDSSGNHVGIWKATLSSVPAGFKIDSATGSQYLIGIEVSGSTGDAGSTVNSQLASTGSAASLTSGSLVASVDSLIFSALIDQNSRVWSVGGSETLIASAANQDRDIASYRQVAAGTYTTSFSDSTSAGQTAAMAVIVINGTNSAPTINTQPADQQANIGGSAAFNIAATTSGGALSYQWKFNGSNVGTNSASYTRTGVVYGDQRGAVTCDVTDSNGTTVSATARLLVTFAAAGTGPRRRNILGITAVGTLGILGAATGGPAYSATGKGGGLASSTETTARLDTGTTRATGAAAATETTTRIAAASATGTGRAAGTGAKGVAWAATGTATGKAATTASKGASASITARGTGVGSVTGLHGAAFAGTTNATGAASDSYTVASVRSSSATATGGGMATGAGLHATAQSGLARAGGRALATEATARTAAGVTLAIGKATATETTARTAAATIKAGGLVADAYSVAFIRATFGTATGGGRGAASGLHAIALQGITRAGGKVTGAALHAVALSAIVKGGGTVATVGAKSVAWSVSVRGGGLADDSYLINHIDYARAPAGGRAFHLRNADTARPHEAETERPAVISGNRGGNINTSRPANRGGRRT